MALIEYIFLHTICTTLTGSYNHWVCVQYGNQVDKEVHLMDSLGLTMSVGKELVLQIASIYKCDEEVLTIRKLGVQQQIGTWDCGLFAVAYAVEVCSGCFDQTRMREHLYSCLQEGVLKPFPQIRSQARRNLVLRATSQH